MFFNLSMLTGGRHTSVSMAANEQACAALWGAKREIADKVEPIITGTKVILMGDAVVEGGLREEDSQ